MKRYKWRKHIPIFDLCLYLVEDASPRTGYLRLPKSFQSCDQPGKNETATALSDGNGKFAILIGNHCTEGFIAHEVSHVVDFMMSYLEARPKKDGEIVGLLSHYITDWIYAKLIFSKRK